MATIADIRKQYPQYADVSDADLVKAFHTKFYSDIPLDEFSRQLGLTTTQKTDKPVGRNMKWVGTELVDVNDPAYSTANMPSTGVRQASAVVDGKKQLISNVGGYSEEDLQKAIAQRNPGKTVSNIQDEWMPGYTRMVTDPTNPFEYLSSSQKTEAGPVLQQTGNVVNTLLRGGSGVAKGAILNPILAGAQVLGGQQFVEDTEKAYQQQRQAAGGEGFDWAQLIGSVVSPVNRFIPGNSLIKGSIGGSLFSPVEGENLSAWDIAKGKAEQAAVGAVGGSVLATVLPAFKVGAKKLLEQGVDLTTGQSFGGVGGALAGSVDFLGDMIKKATGKEVSTDAVRKTFTYAAVNEALAPIKQFVPKASEDGFEMVNKGLSKFNTAYPEAFAKVGRVAEDVPFQDTISTVSQTAKSMFTENKNYNKFMKELKTNVIDKFDPITREIDGKQLHEIKRWLQAKTKNLSKATDEDDLVKASLYKDIVSGFTDFTHRVDTTGVIKATDTAYANMLRISEAAKQASKHAGNFGPEQLSSVAATMAPGLSGGKGIGPLQQYAKEATKVIGKDINEGITMSNLKNAGLLTGAGYAGFLNPLTTVPLGALGLSIETIGVLAKKNPALYEKIREEIARRSGLGMGNILNQVKE